MKIQFIPVWYLKGATAYELQIGKYYAVKTIELQATAIRKYLEERR